MLKGKGKLIGSILAIIIAISGALFGLESDAVKSAICGADSAEVAK